MNMDLNFVFNSSKDSAFKLSKSSGYVCAQKGM